MRIAMLRNIIREEMKAKLKKGMDSKMIKKQISSIEQQIEDEEGGEGEPLTNETLQDLEAELKRLKSLLKK